jgi:hypothetical protein
MKTLDAEMVRAIVAKARARPKTAVGLGAVVALVATLWGGGEELLAVGEWFATHETSHGQVEVIAQVSSQNQSDISGLIEAERQKAEKAKADAEAEKKRRDYVAYLCRSGKLPNREECAKVGVSLPEPSP